jgi:hypothetical protein
MVEEQIIQEFKSLEISSSFISKNFSKLQKEYGDKYIAVKEEEVIANAKTFEDLVAEINKQGLHIQEVLIDYIPKEGVIILY